MNYTFLSVNECNMCSAGGNNLKVLGRRLNTSQGKRPSKKIGITTTIMQCKNCGLIYSNPLPVPSDIQDHYGLPPEEYWQNEYYSVNPDYFNSNLKTVEKLMDFKTGMKALDIGAGLGKAMFSMQAFGFDSYGIEPSVPFFERAINSMNLSPDRLKLTSMEEAEYSPEFFDFITFGAVLEHLYDPNLALEKALSWLKPGGIIHIEVPSSDWLTHKIINRFYRFKGSDYVANLSPMHPPYHLYEFSLLSFSENGKRLGYFVAHSEYYVCDTFLPRFLNPIIKPYMRRFNKGMQLCVYLRKD